AAEDNTAVDLMLTAPSEGGIPAGLMRRVTLQRGQCYLVKSAPIAPKQGDLTGSVIRANRPIAVISGHARTSVPQGLVTTVDSKDHLAEWLMPDQTITNEYFTTPFYTDARIPVGDILRIVATQPNTSISVYTERQDISYLLKNAGDVQTMSGVNSPAWIRADKPVTVGQYMLTGSVGGSSGYDPSLTIIAPTDKYITRSVFQAPFNLGEPAFATQYQKHFVNLMCDSLARTSLKLDGVNIGKNIAPEILTAKFRSSPFFWAVIPISPGKHEITCDTGFFTGTLYGMGYTDSYAHTLGFATIAGKSDTLAPQFSYSVACGVLTGTVRETANATSTGISFVAIDADSTKNYDFDAVRVAGDVNTMTWTARPTDPYKDAKIFIVTRDKAGNGRVFRYYYRAPRFTQTTSLVFTAKTENDSLCQRLFVQNPSATDTLVLRSVRLAGSVKEFVLNSPLPLPLRVPNKGGIDFAMCFLPRGQSGLKVTDTVIFDIGCGLSIRVVVRGSTPTSAMRVDDVDFGQVNVGDTVCSLMRVVNSGTRTATITTAYLGFPTAVFTSDAATLLPKTLATGDSLFLRVCFAPTDTFDLKRDMVFENSLALDVRGEVHGQGIRSILRADSIDAGARRIATFVDTNVVIRNAGNATAELTYTSQSGDTPEFLHSLPLGRGVRIPPKDSFVVTVRFYPQAVGDYRSVLRFVPKRPKDAVIDVVLRGRGTLPQIAVSDVDFDTINVGATRRRSPRIVRSLGNESLTIDTVSIQGPDAASFRISDRDRAYRVLPTGDSLAPSIDFVPKRPGLHTMTLVVRHDADRAYFRRESTIIVRGWARDTTRDDTTTTDTTSPKARRPSIRIAQDAAFACDSLRYSIVVANADTIPIPITDIRVRTDVSSDTLVRHTTLRIVPAGKRDSVSGALTPPIGSGSLRVTVKAGVWTIDTVIGIRTTRAPATVALLGPVSGNPDDTVRLVYEGRWERGSVSRPLTFAVRSTVPADMLDPLTDMSVLRFRSTGRTVPVDVVRTADGIRVATRAPIVVGIPEGWTFEIPCLALLSQQRERTVTTTLEDDGCTASVPDTTVILVAPVCADDVRHIAFADLAVRAVFPVPVSDDLRMEIDAKSSDVAISIHAVDMLGRKFPMAEKLFLGKGLNSLIFDTHSLTDGLYRIELRSRDIEFHIPIIVIK
ncbi:MAG: choice-of-anchor D domain-containing protein, partial [Candidatus Kapaibacterium sp.]